MNMQKYVLDNGLRIVGVPIQDSPTTTIMVLVGVGSRYERSKEAGLSHFLEHMMFKGTKNRPNAQTIAQELDGMGASYNAFTGYEYTGYWIKTRNAHSKHAIEIISDIFQHSKFTQRDLSIERGAVIEEMRMYEDFPTRKIYQIFQNLMYGNSPLGNPIIGNIQTLEAFDSTMMKEYYASHYGAQNTTIVIAGKVNDTLIKKVQRDFQYTRNIGSLKPSVAMINSSSKHVMIEQRDTDQLHIMYGFPTISYTDSDKYTANIISTILGGYMSSRLFSEIREKRGLAYYVRADQDSFSDTGFMSINAGIRKDSLLDVIHIIQKELYTLKNQLVPLKELTIAKEYIKGQMVMGIESSDEVASTVAMHEILYGQDFSLTKELAGYEKVTAQDIKNFMTQYESVQNARLCVIGNVAQNHESQLNKLLMIR